MASLFFLKTVLFARIKHKNGRKQSLGKRISQTQVIQSVLCRICNKNKADIPIFDFQRYIDIPKEIKEICGVTILKQDNFSKYICHSCLQLLKGCISFREMCQNTNKVLTQLSIKKETKNIKDKACKIYKEEDKCRQVASPRDSDDDSQQFFCSVCNKGFTEENTYFCHIKECKRQNSTCKKTEKPIFLCEICGRTAPNLTHLMIHMNIHNNIFPFKCDMCPYRGRNRSLLKVHKRRHLPVKPFKCPFCPKSTTTSSNLSQHVQSVHSNNRPFKCTHCGTGFANKLLLTRHEKSAHFKQPVECNICFKIFSSRKGMRDHQVKIHKVKGRHGRIPAYLQAQEEESQTFQTEA